jgi:hypothetical protein
MAVNGRLSRSLAPEIAGPEVGQRDPIGKKKHEAMGFHQGWGTALDQLVQVAKEFQR